MNTSDTYLATMNYWAPLRKTEEDKYIEETNTIGPVQLIENTNSNKWTPSQELKKVIVEIYCIEKCLLDLDPI
jgi:hypothetical protein